MVRILMLPGYTQSAAIMKGRMGAIRKSLPASADLVFIDPTHIVDMPTTSAAMFDSNASNDAESPEMIPRSWWFAEAKEGFRHFDKMDETVVYLRKVLEEQGPFDGVWGFSQGAACAAILTGLLENPSANPTFAEPGPNWPPPPFRFSILSAGFLPMDPVWRAYFSKPLITPSLHILGRGDTIVSADRSVPLTEAFVDARVEWHEGGHHTPSKAQFRKFYKEYLDLFAADGPGAEGVKGLLSPGEISSGTSTPNNGRL